MLLNDPVFPRNADETWGIWNLILPNLAIARCNGVFQQNKPNAAAPIFSLRAHAARKPAALPQNRRGSEEAIAVIRAVFSKSEAMNSHTAGHTCRSL